MKTAPAPAMGDTVTTETFASTGSCGHIPDLSKHHLTLPGRMNDPTFWGLNAEQREHVQQLYREARIPARRVLVSEKEIAVCRGQMAATNDELDTIILGPEYDNRESGEERRSRWVTHESRMDNVRNEIRHKRERVNHMETVVEELETPLRQLAKDCAIMLCLPFTSNVSAALPAELRDQVYDYLWDGTCIDDLDGQIALRCAKNHDTRVTNDWCLSVPSFADVDFVGEPFAREAATYFFRMLTKAEIHYRLVRAFLQIKTFGNMSFRPRDVIRFLKIDVAWSISGGDRFAYGDLRENLKSLLHLPAKEDFAIEIFLPRDMQFSRTLYHVLDIIRPIYHVLVQKSVKIKVLGFRFFTPSWREHPQDTIVKASPFEYTTAELLNCYFDGTAEAWFLMKEAEIAKIKKPLRRQKCFEVLDHMRITFRDMGTLTGDEITWPGKDTSASDQYPGLLGL